MPFFISVIAALACFSSITTSIAVSNAITGTVYDATFDEASASSLDPASGVVPVNITYQGLSWSGISRAIQKPYGTATTYFLIPESPPQYGHLAPHFTDLPNGTRAYGPPVGVLAAPPNRKVSLNGFYFGCSRPNPPVPGYFNEAVNCTLNVQGNGGIGGTSQFTYIDYTPVIGDCAELGSSTTGLAGSNCARLMYVGAGLLASQGPFQSIQFTLNPYLNERANETSVFFDDISYETHLLSA